MNYKELMNQPSGVLFCEIDQSVTPLLVKTGNTENDITVRGVFHPVDNGAVFRYGFDLMSESHKNSLDFHVLTQSEIQGVGFDFIRSKSKQ